jgi:hypothetical protein
MAKCKCKGDGRVKTTSKRFLSKGEFVLPYGVKPTKQQKLLVPKKCGGLKSKRK